MDDLRLKPADLRWICDPNQFEFETTAELPPLEGTIGQDRALTAIDFGLGIKNSGFNLFILGHPGSGRSSTIKKILKSRAGDMPVPDDWCYLHNFEDDTGATAIRLPAGKGFEFKKDVEHLVERLAEEVPKVFESKDYQDRKKEITAKYQEQKKQLFEQLEEDAGARGFTLQQTASGLILVPLKKGKPLSQEEYEQLADEDKAEVEAKGAKLQERINEVLHEIRKIEEEMREKILAMEKETLFYSMGHLFEDLEQKYAEFESVLKHFEQCKQDILDQLEAFRPKQEAQLAIAGLGGKQEGPDFQRYQVNLLVDNTQLEGAPVVYEANPTYFNVFGRIEHVIQMGSAVTSFQMIKAGALHRANGGYLILDCREVLLNLFTYEALKRCIRNREVKIEDMTEQFRLMATASLKPQPIPFDCKVVLIGTPIFYYMLFQLDPDFRKYFKVKVDFDQMMKNTWENVQQHALFIGSKCNEEKLLHFEPEAVARMVEYSSRLIEDQSRFSSSFIDIADLIREASFYAEREERDRVGGQHVELALEARIYRSNKLEERIQESIDEGTLLIDTEGSVTGQINGLTVYLLGDYSFGRPVRVTARTFIGKQGLVNIERETRLSGPIHDKGVMILNGFFGERYARERPLALSASICFEQSYAGVEGDSASTTELYGLLSSLADLPIRQGIAVTGSVNQHGRVQPIGGVSKKIEGFFAVCKGKGLTGEQGVIIPAANRRNLMLKTEVIEAVHAGSFHVWSVETVDQGIEILTGVPAGERDADGRWPADSVNGCVDRRLREMTEAASRFAQQAGKEQQ
ncbi:MAG TPA: ATP-binding protein [Desulfuromonadales bacterium]|nr:ATP-binding protein [Desulfuromonadales bacterium]